MDVLIDCYVIFIEEVIGGGNFVVLFQHDSNSLPGTRPCRKKYRIVEFNTRWIDRLIAQRLRRRITLSEDPSFVGDDCGNGSSGSKGAFSPIALSFSSVSMDSCVLLKLFWITETSAGNSNFPKNSPRTTLAKSSMLNVIEISISNQPTSC